MGLLPNIVGIAGAMKLDAQQHPICLNFSHSSDVFSDFSDRDTSPVKSRAFTLEGNLHNSKLAIYQRVKYLPRSYLISLLRAGFLKLACRETKQSTPISLLRAHQ
ncbi:MAG: hypothetical protein CBB68_05755 [Rhodospirillaceae bacterium TMED8]|nr:hypothetical protein [Magnetovibrio sp.]OUT51132.1 MAG: hypothetical protein CBB68_05755 [Rhodospirillaceae bacterium TMED8]|tara:strand:+ start:3334 stop:3648 length:315 start_codon:yes stop_codon:yes gene_type:complete